MRRTSTAGHSGHGDALPFAVGYGGIVQTGEGDVMSEDAGGRDSDEQTVGWLAVGPMEAYDREHGRSAIEVAGRYAPDRVKVQAVYRWEGRALFCEECGRPLPTVGAAPANNG